MSFPYNTPPQWETLHSPQDTPVPTPSSATFRLHLDDQLPGGAPTIDNTPILLHHPTENPQMQERHRPRAPSGTGTPSMHPIDALIFSRPGSASSTHTGGSSIHTMGMGHIIQQHFASSPESGSTPAPTAGPSSSKQTTGALRTTRARTAATASSHPYLRQTPSSSSSPFMQNIGIPPTSGPTIMTRSKARKQSVKFADAPTTAPDPTSMGMEPITHHSGHSGMVERPVASSSGGGGGGTMQPLQRSGAAFFGTTVTTGCAAVFLIQILIRISIPPQFISAAANISWNLFGITCTCSNGNQRRPTSLPSSSTSSNLHVYLSLHPLHHRPPSTKNSFSSVHFPPNPYRHVLLPSNPHAFMLTRASWREPLPPPSLSRHLLLQSRQVRRCRRRECSCFRERIGIGRRVERRKEFGGGDGRGSAEGVESRISGWYQEWVEERR